MSLINCPECSHRISDHAKACPQCGYELTLNIAKSPKKGPRTSFPQGTSLIRKVFKLPTETVMKMKMAQIHSPYHTQAEFVNEAILEYSQHILSKST